MTERRSEPDIEAERRRIARRLEQDVLSALNLLAAQVGAYQQALQSQPQAQMAMSIVASLTQQALQKTRDLQANLNPSTLELLGLEAALDQLAEQEYRAHGFKVALKVQRLPQRLPESLELVLYRFTQGMIERAREDAHASEISIRLNLSGSTLTYELEDNGIKANPHTLNMLHQRIQQNGGRLDAQVLPEGHTRVRATFTLQAAVSLTSREKEIICLVAQGMGNKAIAAHLTVSPRTVNFHLDNIYAKLGINTRTEAAVYAVQQGWVKPE